MKIYICPKGHKYDGEYFKTCPHCMKEGNEKPHRNSKKQERAVSTNSQASAPSKKSSSKDFQQEIDNVKEIIHQSTESHKKEDQKPLQKKPDPCQTQSMVFMISMSSKIVRNQETSIDLCLFEASFWREGADMLRFKDENGIRDIKTLSLPSSGACHLTIYYKDQSICEEDLLLEDMLNRILSIMINIPDNRDRRNHMLKIEFTLTDYNLKEILHLQPQIT